VPALLRIRGGPRASHIHVGHAGRYAKFWLDPVTLAEVRGFRDHELTELRRLVLQNRQFFLERWHEYFSGNLQSGGS
jgi:hypothetical protein